MTADLPFDFVDGVIEFSSEAYALVVPRGISSKDELLNFLAQAGHFPSYFGANWDALSDCLRDFSWVRQREIVIAHNDVPLAECPPVCRVYLDVLRDAVADWAREADAQNAHELHVLFPKSTESVVRSLV